LKKITAIAEWRSSKKVREGRTKGQDSTRGLRSRRQKFECWTAVSQRSGNPSFEKESYLEKLAKRGFQKVFKKS